MISAVPGFEKTDVYHMGIIVDDVPKAVETWSRIYGAGPFYYFTGAVYDELLFRGRPVTFHEQSAYGKWGRFAVELQRFVFDDPVPELEDLLGVNRPGAINHAGFLADDPAAASARLESLGVPLFLQGRLGENTFYWHDARDQIGHFVEVYNHSEGVRKFHKAVAREASDWDGSDPLRTSLPVDLQEDFGSLMGGAESHQS